MSTKIVQKQNSLLKHGPFCFVFFFTVKLIVLNAAANNNADYRQQLLSISTMVAVEILRVWFQEVAGQPEVVVIVVVVEVIDT